MEREARWTESKPKARREPGRGLKKRCVLQAIERSKMFLSGRLKAKMRRKGHVVGELLVSVAVVVFQW